MEISSSICLVQGDWQHFVCFWLQGSQGFDTLSPAQHLSDSQPEFILPYPGPVLSMYILWSKFYQSVHDNRCVAGGGEIQSA